MELEDSINITYGTLDHIFQIFDTEDVSDDLEKLHPDFSDEGKEEK